MPYVGRAGDIGNSDGTAVWLHQHVGMTDRFIGFIEGCVIKYVSRWRAKGGVDDLRKARHFIDLLIELEERDVTAAEDAPAPSAASTPGAYGPHPTPSA